MKVILKDFQPINNWELDHKSSKWENSEEPQFIIDQTTNRRYLNEDPDVVRVKCLLVTLGTPFVHSVAMVVNIAYRILKLISGAHFWLPNDKEKSYNFKVRLLEAAKDILRIVAAPLTLVGLELATIYGMICPYDGRKLFASLERAEYNSFIIAPCFQPEPKQHAFGGDINTQNTF